MASKRSKEYPHQWPDGTWHSIPWAQHVQNMQKPDLGTNTVGYSPAAINVLNGLIPGGTGVQGVPGVAPQPAAPLPQQPDPVAQAAILAANNNIALSDADAAFQTGQLARSSGIDQSGNFITGGDAYDPFSQAMRYQDAYKASRLGNTNSYAARGQLYSGALVNAQNAADKSYAGNIDALRTSALQGYHGISQGRLQTYAGNTLSPSSASFDSLLKQLYPGG